MEQSAAQKRSQEKKISFSEIEALLNRQEAQIQKAAPVALVHDRYAERFVRIALTTIRKNENLQLCTPSSILACVMDCAALGLEPDNVLGLAYLVHSWDGKQGCYVCRLQIGYKGYANLAYRSGLFKSLVAQAVYEGDEFHFEYGTSEKLFHRPSPSPEGEPIAAYAYAVLKEGGIKFDVMWKNQVDGIKGRSSSKNKDGKVFGPWVSDYAEMAKKTVFRRMAKYLPLSKELVDAMSKEDSFDDDFPQERSAPEVVMPDSKSEPIQQQLDQANGKSESAENGDEEILLEEIRALMRGDGIQESEFIAVLKSEKIMGQSVERLEDNSIAKLNAIFDAYAGIKKIFLSNRRS